MKSFQSKKSLIRVLILPIVLAMIMSLLPAMSLAASASPKGNEITRAEFIAELTDYFGWPHPSEYNDIWEDYAVEQGLINYTFKDVNLSDPYGKQVEAAYAESIIGPDAQGNFYPNGGITREDAAVILVNAFRIPQSTTPTPYVDDAAISDVAKGSVYALVQANCMTPRTAMLFMPKALIKKEEVAKIMKAITSTFAAPVYALPRPTYTAPRRYVKLYTADPEATIIFTKDGSEPKVWDVAKNGYINEMISGSSSTRDVVYKAYSMKEGLITSPVQTFTWHLYRPSTAPFASKKILEGTATSPTVYEIWNDSESVRAMAWYIEGPERGILFDNLQTSAGTRNLKIYVDQNLATKPYIDIVGHAHPDHDAQVGNFISAGVDTYSNIRGWSSLRSLVSDTDKPLLKNIDWGQSFDLGGGIVFDVYALPGHNNDLVILNDKKNGLVFATDIYGCTRAGSADNVNVSGVRADLLLSLAQQVHSAYQKDGAKVNMLFTGHDETPLNENNLNLFEQALQQVVDKGEAGCSPTLRGNNDAAGSRTTLIDDMWKDNTNWISLKLAGIMGDNTEYLTHNDQFNYNGADGYLKYSVLSNIEFKGAALVGTDVAWANPSTFTWLGQTITVKNSLPGLFNPWVYDYKIRVAVGTEWINVIPTTMSTKVQSIAINGNEVTYRSEHKFRVSDGSVITLTIVAPDGATTSTYTFTVEEF